MLPQELKQAIATIQAALDTQEKIALPAFARKLERVAEACPEDITVGQMSLIVDKMNRADRLFITRAEVKDLYQKLYTVSSKFRDHFSDELGIEKTAEEDNSISDVLSSEYEQFDIFSGNDQSAVAEMSSAIDPAAQTFGREAAIEAENVVRMATSFPGLVPSLVRASGGTRDQITVTAAFETPSGRATVSIPVDMAGKRAAEAPSFFNGQDGTHYLSHKSLAGYIRGYFQKQATFAENPIEEEAQSPAVETLSLEMETPAGQAAFQHGDLARQASRMVAQKMKTIGKRASQVKIIDSSNEGMTFGVSGDGFAFKVPVQVRAGRIEEPGVVLCRGSVESFDREGIENLQRENIVDTSVAAGISSLFETDPSKLVDIVREAASEGDYVQAEDALNVLQESGDEKAYQMAVSEYGALLGGGEKKVEAKSRCTRIIHNANSTQPICGHLNLPLSKVAQDNLGECVPRHRKEMMDSNAGTLFMDSKVYL